MVQPAALHMVLFRSSVVLGAAVPSSRTQPWAVRGPGVVPQPTAATQIRTPTDSLERLLSGDAGPAFPHTRASAKPNLDALEAIFVHPSPGLVMKALN